MVEVRKSVLVEYSAAQMFHLVDAVEEYALFLPWCGGTEVIHRDESKTVASIRIRYAGIKTAFSTENDKDAPHLMLMRLRDGPFRHLDGRWHFKPIGDAACKVEFHLRYEFSRRLLERTLGPIFNRIADTFVDSFVRRAAQVYQ